MYVNFAYYSIVLHCHFLKVCLIPNSAHGTNPASAAMAGLKVVGIPTNKEGMILPETVNEKVHVHNYILILHTISILQYYLAYYQYILVYYLACYLTCWICWL